MTTDSVHFKDEIQDLLDNRLAVQMRTRVEAHLATCAECHREYESLRDIQRAARKAGAAGEVPADISTRILAALDREDQRRRSATASMAEGILQRKPVLAFGLLAVTALILLILYIARPADLASAVAQDYAKHKAGKLPLDIKTESTQTMEKFFAGRGIPFRTRVFDLGMMRYRLVGGRVQALANRQSAFFVYRGEGNKQVGCQMYEGKVLELPRAEEQRQHNGITFYIYHKKGRTLVFWQEGSVTCVLVSDIATEEVVQLAFAKAMKV